MDIDEATESIFISYTCMIMTGISDHNIIADRMTHMNRNFDVSNASLSIYNVLRNIKGDFLSICNDRSG